MKYLDLVVEASIKAGEVIMDVYNSDNLGTELKEDNSPVTLADKKASDVIENYLKETQIPFLNEETHFPEYSIRKDWKRFWMIDPLDGTKEFIKKGRDFTVNIALIENDYPVMGVIYVPAKKELYFGAKDEGAFFLKLENTTDVDLSKAVGLPFKEQRTNYVVVGSKSHMNTATEEYIDQLRKEHGELQFASVGSSLKMCLVAEGNADIYPRLGPIMEWDIAAGHAICEAAGCKVTQINSDLPMEYNKEDLHQPFFKVYR